MEDNIIKCPSCGEQVPAGTENCPSCGAPIGVLGDKKAVGTPIDNTAAINAMLQNSSMLVEEGKALGVGDLDSVPDDEDGEDGAGGYQAPAEAAPPSKLTPEQEKALKSGGVIELTPANPDLTPHPVGAVGGDVPPISGIPGIPGIPGGSPMIIEENGGAQIFEVNEKGESEKKKRHGKKKSSVLSTVIAVVLALAIGCGAGFFGKMFFFPDLTVPSCQDFAQKSAEAVMKVASGSGVEFYVLKAYVKEGVVAKQCLIRGICDNGGEAVPKWYRVKVENGSEETVHVYTELNEEEYQTLKNSSYEGDRIKAAMLSSIQEETNRCVEEISGGTWTEANAAAINNKINPYSTDKDNG